MILEDTVGKRVFDKWWLENWTVTCKKNETVLYLIPLTKINSEWIKDLNIRPETTKLLEEKIGEKFIDIGLGNESLDTLLISSCSDYVASNSVCLGEGAGETSNGADTATPWTESN